MVSDFLISPFIFPSQDFLIPSISFLWHIIFTSFLWKNKFIMIYFNTDGLTPIDDK